MNAIDRKRITNLRVVAGMTLLLVMSGAAAATEYFVSLEGCDATHDGRAGDRAFASIQRGVDALEPGDTLTILPGEYFGAVSRADMGSADVDTVIRAAIPGTVLLRGDVPAPPFEPTSGFRFVFQSPFPHAVQAVNEWQTLEILEGLPSVDAVEFTPGAFHYDADAQMLYISTSDFQTPDQHHYTLSIAEGRGGIFLYRGNRVIIDGLAATGFHGRDPLPRLRGGNSISDSIPWGFFLSQNTGSAVRNSIAFLNAGGIAIQSGSDAGGNVIEGCTAYGNFSRHGQSGGNLSVFNPKNDAIRDSHAYKGRNHGIRMHGASDEPGAVFADNTSWGHRGADFQIKTAQAAQYSRVSRCVSPHKTITAPQERIEHCVIGAGDVGDATNLHLDRLANVDPRQAFADPDNFDFRLQPGAPFRGAGPNGGDQGPIPYLEHLFYLSVDGDDAADGLSTATAWRSLEHALSALRPGDTLFVEEGTYAGGTLALVDGGERVVIRARGRGQVVIDGPMTLRGAGAASLEGLTFSGGVSVFGGREVGFANCRFVGSPISLDVEATEGLRVVQSLFTGFARAALRLTQTRGVFLRGNLIDNANGARAVMADLDDAVRYSDYNAYRHGEGALWNLAGTALDLAQIRQHHETYAKVRAPAFVMQSGVPHLQNPLPFAFGGPLGNPLGPYNPIERHGQAKLRIVGPFVRSTSKTSANLEWWASEAATFTVAWGDHAEMSDTLRLSPTPAYHPGSPLEPFNTFSLHDLQPDTAYHFRLVSAHVGGDRDVQVVDSDPAFAPITFRTAASDRDPRVLHVATDGDNHRSGTSRQAAWRTLSHAAGQVAPGDTVWVHGGVYHELVRIRVTGTEGAPIVFRAAPGEKVVLDGHNKNLPGAISIANKAFIEIDGFYFTNFQRAMTQGVIRINRSNDIRITRCFADGRQTGTDPEFITAGSVRNLLVRNCVIMGGWDGIGAGNPENLRIEHNVLIRPSIRQVCISAPRSVDIRNNLITDNLRSKMGAFLVQDHANIRVAGNAFFLRASEAERPVFGRDGRRLADYARQRELADANWVGDPLFAALVAEAEYAAGLFEDGFLRRINDFPDAFATHPELIERGIGLQPDAFADFHFNQNTTEQAD